MAIISVITIHLLMEINEFAFVAMDTFLQKNDLEITASEKDAYKMMIQVASGQLSKKELTLWFENNTNSIE